MKKRLLNLFLLVVMVSCHSKGQQKTILKSGAGNEKPASSGNSEIVTTIPEKTYPGLVPGAIAPDAVQIDADEIRELINGKCIVKKGRLQALIDLKGNFIIPYGDYELFGSAPFSTLIGVKNRLGSGYDNLKGETVIPLKYTEIGQFDCRKITSVNIKTTRYLIDTKGNILSDNNYSSVSIPHERELFDRPQSELFKFFQGNAWGYRTRSGQVIIAPQFRDATEYTDGMAAVSQVDQFGAKKWGFIDTKGKLVIPYMFTVMPGHFHEGLALVQPAQRDGFNFAYIDKTGSIKFKIGNGDLFSPYFPCGEMHRNSSVQTGAFFMNGYAIWRYGDQDYRFCDKSGTMHKLAELANDPELANDSKGLLLDNYDDRFLYFQKASAWQMTNAHGVMDYHGNIAFPAAFLNLKADYFSPYAIADRLYADENKNEKHMNGIINNQGVFVLVLKQKSVF